MTGVLIAGHEPSAVIFGTASNGSQFASFRPVAADRNGVILLPASLAGSLGPSSCPVTAFVRALFPSLKQCRIFKILHSHSGKVGSFANQYGVQQVQTNANTQRSKPERLLRLPDVESLTSLRKSSIYSGMKDGTFPCSVRLSARAVAWRESDIAAWQAQRQQTGGAHD